MVQAQRVYFLPQTWMQTFLRDPRSPSGERAPGGHNLGAGDAHSNEPALLSSPFV